MITIHSSVIVSREKEYSDSALYICTVVVFRVILKVGYYYLFQDLGRTMEDAQILKPTTSFKATLMTNW